MPEFNSFYFSFFSRNLSTDNIEFCLMPRLCRPPHTSHVCSTFAHCWACTFVKPASRNGQQADTPLDRRRACDDCGEVLGYTRSWVINPMPSLCHAECAGVRKLRIRRIAPVPAVTPKKKKNCDCNLHGGAYIKYNLHLSRVAPIFRFPFTIIIIIIHLYALWFN